MAISQQHRRTASGFDGSTSLKLRQRVVLDSRFFACGPSWRSTLKILAVWVAMAVCCDNGFGGAPTLDYLFPAGGQQGATFEVQAGGKMEPWPLEASADCREIRFNPLEKEGTFRVTIGSNCLAGPYLVRVYSKDGASAPRTFVVGKLSEQQEIEPNNGADEVQIIQHMPVTLNGQLNKGGDVDTFRLTLAEGRTLVAAVDSYSIGSPIDAHLHLYGPDGVRVAFSHDTCNLDPLLTVPIPVSGEYTLQIAGFAHPPQANIRFHGGADVVYRLSLTSGPWAAYAYPAGVRRTVDTPLEVHGWNVRGADGVDRVRVKIVDACGKRTTDALLDGYGNRVVIAVDDLPEMMEADAVGANAEGSFVELPVIVNGRIDPEGDSDRFRFRAAKGVAYEFLLRSSVLGFALDGVLRVEDREGKRLEQDDDKGADRDARIRWTAPTDGEYCVIVQDLFDRGGREFVYRLHMGVVVPDFTASVSLSQLALQAGGTAELKVKVDRENGHKELLKIEMDDLPEGVTCEADAVPEKGGEVKLTLAAAEEIPSASRYIRVNVVEVGGFRRRLPATFSLLPTDYRGPLLVNETDRLWLTVE